MAVPGDDYPSAWSHRLLRGLDASPVGPKLSPALARLAAHGWTDHDMNDYLARVDRVTGTYHAIIAADFCVQRLPGIAPDQVAGWVLFFHDPVHTGGAESPTEALYYWLDDGCPVSIAAFAHAAGGDHELALLALTADVSLAELTRRVADGTADRAALRRTAQHRTAQRGAGPAGSGSAGSGPAG